MNLQIIMRIAYALILDVGNFLGIIGQKRIDFEDLKLRAFRGNPIAQYKLAYKILHDVTLEELKTGYGYNHYKDDKEAIEWLKKSAESGHKRARYKLGNIYEFGSLTTIADPKKAIEWYEKAAYQGHEKACNRLAEMYEGGRGTRKDSKQAQEWYEKANQNPDLDTLEEIKSKENTLRILRKLGAPDEKVEAQLEKIIKRRKEAYLEYEGYIEE